MQYFVFVNLDFERVQFVCALFLTFSWSYIQYSFGLCDAKQNIFLGNNRNSSEEYAFKSTQGNRDWMKNEDF